MGKKRIHELAKELSLTSADLIQKIQEWKLLPGVKLVASSGLEDYLVEDINRRLNSPDGGQNKGAPQVVRRRKKLVDQQDADGLGERQDESEVEEPVAFQPEPETPAAVEPVRPINIVRPPKGESATIIATITPRQLKDNQKNVPGVEIQKEIPDFKKLIPGAPQIIEELPKAVESQTVLLEPNPEPASVADKTVEPLKKGRVDPKPPLAKAGESKPVPRKIIREISDPPAKIIAPPKNFDAAKVVGVKANWGGAPPGGGGAPPRGGEERQPYPARRPQPGQPDSRNEKRGERSGADWPARKPVAADPLKAAGVRGGFRGAADPAPASELEISRRKDKKKKSVPGARTEPEDGLAGSRSARRRDVVERVDLYSEGDWERVRRRGKNIKKGKLKAEASIPKAIKRRIKVDEAITVSDLAHRLSIKAGDIIKKLMTLGVMAGMNQSLDFDTATLVASEFGYDVEKSAFNEDNILNLEYESGGLPVSRSPVVTIMGHVDHGKTSLLDYIRKTNIQSSEAGGITQHIGAYHVQAGDRKITFLDTPGHEAFTAMRSRGAQVTDIVILIVAADDGVMPQTREAANHAKAAGVPILVAINKIDKPGADVEKVRREMTEIGLMAEAWGGDTVFVEISAKTGQGVGELLDMILLQADILDLTARAGGPARGRIIEARLDKGRGPVATVLVQEGLLKQGDTYVCGVFYGRIRAMLDDQGGRVAEAGAAIPVEVQGISGVPQAGDEFIVLEDEKQARQVSQHRLLKQRESELVKTSKLTLENLFDNIKAGAVKGLNLIIKTDVRGSLEAIVEAVMKLSTPEMKINIIHQSTGAVSETDIMLASASNALAICFGVRPPSKVQELADAEHIQIRYYDVIYKLIDDIKEAMAGLLDPVKSEKVLGRAEVRLTFVVSKVGTIAGSYVQEGKIARGARARLLRDGVVVYNGRISSLKRVKDDVREVLSGYECGIGFENYNDIKVGDHIEAYQVEETAATVDLIDEAVARAVKATEVAERAKVAEALEKARAAEAAENNE